MTKIKTKEEFVARILAKRAEKKLNEYVENVLVDLTKEDLDGILGEEDEIFDLSLIHI